jgi:hypothetical protein
MFNQSLGGDMLMEILDHEPKCARKKIQLELKRLTFQRTENHLNQD